MLQMFLPMAEFDVFLSVAAQHKVVNLRGGIFNHSSLFDSLPWLAVCRAPLGPRDPKRIGLAE